MGKREHTSGERISKVALKVERELEVINELGLHLRAAVEIAKLASKFGAEIFFIKNKSKANAKSVLSVASLAALKGATLKLVAEGKDAQEAAEAMAKLFKARFGEER